MRNEGLQRALRLSLLLLTLARGALPLASPPKCSGTLSRLVPGAPKIYFVMTRLYGNGTFDAVTSDLARFREMGVNTLWLSPVHEQVEFQKEGWDPNNHGYWPKSHDSIAQSLGGEEGFKKLVDSARLQGIQICLDIVPNHFGYGDEFVIGGKRVSRKDKEYFRTRFDGAPLIAPRERELWHDMDTEEDPDVLLARQRELSLYPLFALPGLRHGNPEVKRYLIDSYKRFVDLGVEMFRIDAAKHMPLPFVYELVEALSAHARAQGKRIRFLNEFTAGPSHALDVFVKQALANVTDGESMLYYDFPLMSELRRLSDPAYRLTSLTAFLRERQERQYALRNLVPIVESHDFEGPIRDAFTARSSYALAEFASLNPGLIHHGSERAGVQTEKRPPVAHVDPEGDVAALTKKLTEILFEYRAAPNAAVYVRHESDDSLLLERRSGGRSLFFALNKGGGAVSIPFAWNGVGAAGVITHAADGVVSLADEPDGRIAVKLESRSFAVFETHPDGHGLFEFLKVKSPPARQLVFPVETPRLADRLPPELQHELAPELTGETLPGKVLPLRVVTPKAFASIEPNFRKRGYWVLFNASGFDPLFGSPVQCGHLLLLVNGRVYSRNADGPLAITSVPIDKLDDDPFTATMLRKSFYLAQFFETEADVPAILEEFLKARIPDQTSGDPSRPGSMRYLFRPLSSGRRGPDTENCSTFTCPWIQKRLVDFRPEITRVAESLGQMTLSELPNFQISLNTDSPALRGTLLVTPAPARARALLKRDGMTKDPEGRELLFAGPLRDADTRAELR